MFVLARLEEAFKHEHFNIKPDPVRRMPSAFPEADDEARNVSRVSTAAGDFYVCQRQSLKLLSDMLLDRAFMQTMLRYINNDV